MEETIGNMSFISGTLCQHRSLSPGSLISTTSEKMSFVQRICGDLVKDLKTGNGHKDEKLFPFCRKDRVIILECSNV